MRGAMARHAHRCGVRGGGLALLAVLALVPAAGPAQAFGGPGATVGLPLGSPDPFGLTTERAQPPAAAPSDGRAVAPRIGTRKPPGARPARRPRAGATSGHRPRR